MATATALLESVEAAILAFTDNQAIQQYTVNGRLVQRAQLPQLTAWRDKLKGEVAAAQTSGGGSSNYFRHGRVL